MERRQLNFSQIRSLKVGHSKLIEVERLFGSPTQRSHLNGIQTLRYDDPSTGDQRLTVNFSEGDQILTDILWIPLEVEPEYGLSGAKAGFLGHTFKEVRESENNPHLNSQGVTLFIDDSTGVTIRYNESDKIVEAIAIYSASNRAPAAKKRSMNAPYTLGENPASPLRK
jgi:hypothetical protein